MTETNPLLNPDGFIDYSAVTPEAIQPAIESLLQITKDQLAALESAPPSDPWNLIKSLEELGEMLGRSWGAVSHLMSVCNAPELREAHAAVQPQVVAFFSSLSQSQPIYNALKSARSLSQGDPELERILDTELNDFIHGGVALPDEQRSRFSAIRQELAKLSTSFANNHLDSTKAWRKTINDKSLLAGLPERVLGMLAHNAMEDGHEEANAENGPWTVSLDAPVLMPVLQHAQNRELRQQVQQAYVTRASEGEYNNKPLIRQILILRQELAELLGFKTYAEVSVDKKMAPSVDAIESLLDDLVAAATPKAKADIERMKALAAADGIEGNLRSWDTAFYAERLRERELKLNEEALRAYFPQQRVLDGLFALLTEVFDIKVVAADGQAPVWHPDVRFFHIHNMQNEVIAAFYLDAHARPGQKRAGAWMNGIFSRSNHLPGGIQHNGKRLPVAVLVTNIAPPADGTESLLSFREVETLFHECGHGLQHMLTTIDCSMTAGIGKIEWDAVELPSQFMEQWCYHPPCLRSISGHHETGEPLPEAEMERLLQARTFNQGMLTLRQCSLARMDLRLHHGFHPESDEDAIALQRQISTDLLPIAPEAYDNFLCGFSHIFAGGYSAGYYSYKWAEVLSADAWSAFEEADLSNPKELTKIGHKFRDTILALGGSQHPMDVFVSFRGREPRAQALINLLGLNQAA